MKERSNDKLHGLHNLGPGQSKTVQSVTFQQQLWPKALQRFTILRIVRTRYVAMSVWAQSFLFWFGWNYTAAFGEALLSGG